MEDPYDAMSAMMSFEEGTLPEDDIVTLFQYLLDADVVYKLQGLYGRTAERLLGAGLIKLRR